jgi:hypothetical protein
VGARSLGGASTAAGEPGGLARGAMEPKKRERPEERAGGAATLPIQKVKGLMKSNERYPPEFPPPRAR